MVSERTAGRLKVCATAALLALLLGACATQQGSVENGTSDAALPNLFPGNVVTTQGREAAGLYLPIFLVAVAIFVLVEGILIYVTLRYRRKATDTDLPSQTHGNNLLELLWTAIPALVVMVMFVGSIAVLTRNETKAADPLTVSATAFQWQWTFEYPDQGLAYTGAGKQGPEMVIPVDEPVRVRLNATDVIHAFYVPQFFTKLDVVPGRENVLEFMVEEPGTYGGQCAEYCGLAHADMFFSVRAVERPEFDAWLAAEVAAAAATPPPPASPEPGTSAAPAGLVLEISTTQDAPLAFSVTSLTAPAATEVTVEYLNDSDLPHDIAFFEGADASAPRLASTEVVAGPGNLQTVAFTTPATPGSYYFHCDVHPLQMQGTLEVTE